MTTKSVYANDNGCHIKDRKIAKLIFEIVPLPLNSALPLSPPLLVNVFNITMTKIDDSEPAYISIYNALKSSVIDPDTDTRTIRRVVGDTVRNLTADMIKYRVKKAISQLNSLDSKFNSFQSILNNIIFQRRTIYFTKLTTYYKYYAGRISGSTSKRVTDEDFEEDCEDGDPKYSRAELLLLPNECVMPRLFSTWKVKRKNTRLNVAFLPPVGVPVDHFKFKILEGAEHLRVTFKLPKLFTEGVSLCDYWINRVVENDRITGYHPKVNGYDKYIEDMYENDHDPAEGRMLIPLPVVVNPGSLSAYKVPLGKDLFFIEIDMEEMPVGKKRGSGNLE